MIPVKLDHTCGWSSSVVPLFLEYTKSMFIFVNDIVDKYK